MCMEITLVYYQDSVKTGLPTFQFNNFDVDDTPHSGRPIQTDKDTMKVLTTANQRIATREVAESLNLSNSTIYKHLICLDLILKLDIWVPYIIMDRNLWTSVICFSYFKKVIQFWSALSLGTRNGLSITMSNARDDGVKNTFKGFRKPIFIKK